MNSDDRSSASQSVSRPRMISLADIFNADYHVADYIIEGMLDTGTKCMLVGPSKIGKSWFALTLAICCALGRAFFGLQVKESVSTLYVNGELRVHKVKDRVNSIMLHESLDLEEQVENDLGVLQKKAGENISFLNLRGYIPDDEEDVIQLIIESALARKAQLVIIDPTYMVMYDDENKSEVVKEFCRFLDEIIGTTGATVVYVHHDTKSGSGDKANIARGSGHGVFQRHYDCSIILSEQEEVENAVVVEGINRDCIPFEPFVLERTDSGIFVRSDLTASKKTKKTENSNKLGDREKQRLAELAIKHVQKIIEFDSHFSTKSLRQFLINQESLSDRNAGLVVQVVLERLLFEGSALGLATRSAGHNKTVFTKT